MSKLYIFLFVIFSGRKALDFFPLDNWAHHALAHNFEESGRPLQVLKGLKTFTYMHPRDCMYVNFTKFDHKLYKYH